MLQIPQIFEPFNSFGTFFGTLLGIAHAAAIIPRNPDSKIVSANVPGLPTETASSANVQAKPTSNIPDDIEMTSVTSTTKSPEIKVLLTASEILKSSIEPKITRLKDILFTFKLYQTYLDKQDYVTFRAGKY